MVETTGKIKRITDRHVYINDGYRLCLAVPPEELLICRHGITTSWFIKNVLLPRLGEEYLVNNGGNYQREYSHGYNGYWEFYFNKFNTSDSSLVINFLEIITHGSMEQRQELCPCGSNKKFKKCHLPFVNKMAFLPANFLKNQIEILKQNKYTKQN